MKKVYNSLEEFSEAVGCFMQPEKVKPTTQWLLYQIIEPNHTRYIGEVHKCYEGDELTKVVDSYGYNVVAVNIGEQEDNTLEDELKMEQYIRECKHLLGCKFVGSPYSGFITAVGHKFFRNTWRNPPIIDDEGYVTSLSDVRLYTEDHQLLPYKEYMQIYYPEYKHVWSDQL